MSVVEFKALPTTAEGWCARLNADDVSEADRKAFGEWLNLSAENRADYELAALTMAVSRGLGSAADLRIEGRNVRPRRAPRVFGVAAGLALLLMTSGWLAWRYLGSGYRTGIGEQKTVALADGSTVQLNTASVMNVDLEPDARHVTLRRGEAFFNVARDPARPFIVRAGASEIRVIGTKFNVRLVDDVARVTVLEGHVKVTSLDVPFVHNSPNGAGAARSATVDLLPGQGASVPLAQPALTIDAIDTTRLTAWREGRIYFDNEPLSTVLQEVNRYTATPFVMADRTKNNLRLSGVFRTGDIQSVAFALHAAYSLEIERRQDRIVVH